MRKLGFPIAILLILLLSSLAIPVNASPTTPLPNEIVAKSGYNFWVNGSTIVFNGINDQTVFYIQYFYLENGYPQYQYSNHLFDDVEGHYLTDTTTHIHSTNYTEFWWKYFYTIQHLGLNLVRLGAFDETTMKKCQHNYYNHKSAWDAVMIPMLDMAELAGVYIDFCFGGGDATYDVSGSDYTNYKNYIRDVMTEYQNETAIALWDLSNEAWTTSSATTFWASHGGYTAFKSWRLDISTWGQTYAGWHLITADAWGNDSKGYGYSGWSEPFLADNFDTCDVHNYFSAEDNYLINNQEHWAHDHINRPLIMGECANNNKGDGYVWPYWWYWPWLYNISQNNSLSNVWMTLWDYPGYPVNSSYFASIPGIPYATEEEIVEAEKPDITTTSPNGTGYNDTEYYSDFDCTGEGVTWTIDTNASWLSIESWSGLVSGDPSDGGGIYWVNVTATNEYGFDYLNYSLTITVVIPVPPDPPPPEPDDNETGGNETGGGTITGNGTYIPPEEPLPEPDIPDTPIPDPEFAEITGYDMYDEATDLMQILGNIAIVAVLALGFVGVASYVYGRRR